MKSRFNFKKKDSLTSTGEGTPQSLEKGEVVSPGPLEEQVGIPQEFQPKTELERIEEKEVPVSPPPSVQPITPTPLPTTQDQPSDVGDDTTSKIPLTQDDIKLSKKRKVTEAIRWLGAWCLRQLKKLGKI